MKKSMLLVIIFAFNTNDYYSQLINFLDPSRGATVAGLSIDYFGPDLSMGMQNQNCFQGLLPNIGAALCSLSDLDSPINSVKPLGTDLFSADPCCSSFPIRSSWWSSSIANYWGYMVVDLGGDRTFNELKVFQSMYYSYNNTFERRGKVTHAQMFTFTLPTASAPSSSSIGWAAVSPAFIVSEGSLDVGNNRTTVIYPTSSTFPRITARYVMFKFKNDGRYHITPPPGKDSNPYDLMVRGIKLFNLDEIPPTARCKNAIVYLDANGNGILNAINIDDDSYDASGIALWELSQTTFTCANIGNNNVTLTVTDNFGNTASCSAVVKVVDNIPPIAICKPITVYLDANGTFNINASALNNGSTDVCGIASFSASQNAFTCANIGTNSVTLTVTDNFGNTASCSSVVTVVDNIPPIAICKPITVYLDDNGTVSMNASALNNGSTDVCPLSFSASQTTFTCANIGTNNVTLTVTDNAGNSASCTSVVTVVDNIPPIAICKPITVYLNANGIVSMNASALNNGSYDVCSSVSFSASQTTFTCTDIGTNTVTLTVTDVYLNSASCTAEVTVVDNILPIANCKPITVYLDATGNVSIDPSSLDNGSADACPLSFSTSATTFTCFDVGANNVTLTVSDNNGNTDFCTAVVKVIDFRPPIASCKPITVYLDHLGSSSIHPIAMNDGSSDACGIALFTASQTTFSCTDLGPNDVTLTVTDIYGNPASCIAEVTVVDDQPPIANCKPITVYLNNLGNATLDAIELNNGSSDACGITSFSASKTTFTCSDLGVHNVTLTVTDEANNTASCTAVVTVVDNTLPIANCKPIVVYLDNLGNGSLLPSDLNNGSSDVCGSILFSASKTTFTCSDVGVNNVILTVTDNADNTASCTALVTVLDTIKPTARCKDTTVYLVANGNAILNVNDIHNGSSDACGILSFSASPTTFTCNDIGANNLTLNVTDNADNTASCVAVVTVVDQRPPIAICKPITVYLDQEGNVELLPSELNNGSFDACGSVSFFASKTTFTCSDIGTNDVTFTVTDSYGNTASCSAVVTVVDNLPPLAICKPITVFLDPTGIGGIHSSDLDHGSFDACGIASLMASDTTFTCTAIGSNTITLILTDNYGNTGTCTSQVTVVDVIPPIVNCKPITVYLDQMGNGSLNPSDLNDGSSDACGIASFATSATTFTCVEIGTNDVTLTVTDNNGNTASCVTEVTVVDNSSPRAICKPITIYLDNLGNAILHPSDLDNGSYDVCGSVSFTASQTTFTCTDIGINNVTLTVSDNADNTSSCLAVVTVVDSILPIARCKNAMVYLEANGIESLNVNTINNGSYDACGIASFSASQTTFTCSDIGANDLTLTVTDNYGTISSCTAVVTVVDSMPPIAVCKPINVYLDATGNVGILPSDLDNGSFDVCSVVSFSASQTIFTCADIGTNDVTLTVTENYGNTASCLAAVTVVDSIPPMAICKTITVYLDQTGNGIVHPSDLDNGSSDVCGFASLMASDTTFTCADVGANNVTLIFTDYYGNTGTCTSEVSVVDVMPPIANCKSITVYLETTGSVSIHPSDLNDGSSDACGIASFATSDSTFTCTDIGTNDVTLSVTDINGNTASCLAVVTVVDNWLPIANCKNDTVYLNLAGIVNLHPISLDNGSSDACGIDYFTTSDSTFNCTEVGLNNIILSVTDKNNNRSYCSSEVTVIDSMKPIVNCKNHTVYLDENGNASLNVNDINNGSNDACGLTSLVASKTSFSCAELGLNNVTLTVTDKNGNVGSCIAVVSVVDTINPIINCENRTEYLNEHCEFIVPDYVVINHLIDNCNTSTITITQTPAVGTVLDTLGNQKITILVTDDGGNIDSCNFTITLMDREAPEVFCPENQELITNYTCIYKIEDYTSLVTNEMDNCDFNAVTISQFPAVGTMVLGELINGSENVAQTRVTMHIEDQSGNKDSCDFIVEVTCLSALVIPEFISPNGDGVNDYFVLEGLERYPENLLIIYNRWGDVVYKSSPYSNAWKGQSNKRLYGDFLSGGSYFYSFQTEPGETPFTGYIILKR